MERSFGLTERGHVRSSNQDCLLLRDDLGLWAVADGMGGHAGGAQAADLACRVLHREVEFGRPVDQAIRSAHEAILRAQAADVRVATMGSTIAAVLETPPNGYRVCWVGDSRIYRYDSNSGQLERLSRDHTIPGKLVASGDLDEEGARKHPERHILTNCLGQPDSMPGVDCTDGEWHSGDWLLLCSDGLTGELEDGEVAGLMAAGSSPEDTARSLVQAALDRGGRDNVSVIVVRPAPV